MVEKKTKGSAPKNSPADKDDQRKTEDKTAAVDRPGFDLGGSTGKTSAGTGLGLGKDAFEKRSDRSLPGRRDKDSK